MNWKQKRILLIGYTGQIGTELVSILEGKTMLLKAARNSGDFRVDLEDKDSILICIQESKPDMIINAAAYTAVDKAEEESQRAFNINAVAPGIIAEQASLLEIPLIHYSTDYVFDGKSESHYIETDDTAPLSQYGVSKLAGEKAVLNACKTAIIFRTSWVYGQHGHNFLLTILRLAKEHSTLRIVSDQFGVPSCSAYVAEMTVRVIEQLEWNVSKWEQHTGLYHLCPTGETSWYEFTREIISNAQSKYTFKVEEIVPITTSEYPTPAKRPAYSVLDCHKFQNTFNLKLDSWQTVLKNCMSEM